MQKEKTWQYLPEFGKKSLCCPERSIRMNNKKRYFPKGGVAVEGTVLFGKYKIKRIIGRGRTGTVFLARHLGLDEYRAIKRVPKSGGERFAEASVLKNLRHPGIPVVYDLEEDSDYYYLIEEYLDGESLYARIEREGSLTKAEQISWGIELCRIIDYLHSFEAYPILYLDLQPHNILICQGALKLIDFDQAVSVSLPGGNGRRYGTRGFAAPEQYTDEPLDVRTDIYAIGTLLYYMGTGNIYPGTEDGLDALAAVRGRCLQRKKEERWQSVREVQEALVNLQAGAFTENQIPLLHIAVVSSSHGMGATHVSLCAASYLLAQGITCLYRERNETGAVRKMAACRNREPDSHGIYHMGKWAMRPAYGPGVRLEQPSYDAVIDDLGTGLQTVLEEDYDLVLFLCGARDWELEDSISSIRILAQKKNLRVMFNHVSPDERLILPGDITSLQLFRLPVLPLPERGERYAAFWDAVFASTEGGKKLEERNRKERRMGGGRAGKWYFIKRCFAAVRRKAAFRIWERQSGSE